MKLHYQQLECLARLFAAVRHRTFFQHSSRICATAAWLGCLLLAGGCSSFPTTGELEATRAVLPAPAAGVVADDRAHFRRIFCAVAGLHGVPAAETAGGCEGLLWRLRDEPAPAPGFSLPEPKPGVQLLIVGGAFSDCFGTASIAYRDAIAQLVKAGVDVRSVPISGRSSAEYNAKAIATTVAASPHGPLVLLGYSKGVVDSLYFLSAYPQLAGRVNALVSIAGPVLGATLADSGDWIYDTFLEQSFAGRCDPGDGGVLDSLLPAARLQWQAAHPLPTQVRYFSLLAFTTEEHIARGLRPSWRILAATDVRNDGQITIEEGALPGSTLLGYANTDHWGLAIHIEEELAFFGGREDPTPYPREVLLEAVVRYVSEALTETGQPGGTAL